MNNRYKAEMNLVNNDSVVAIGNVTVDDCFVIRNVRVMKSTDSSAENTMYVSMPGRIDSSDGKWHSIVSVSKEEKEELNKAVFEGLKAAITKGITTPPMNIRVTPLTDAGNLVGVGTIEMNGLLISGVKILQSKNASDVRNPFFVSMPQYKTKDGEWHDIVFETSSSTRYDVQNWVLDAYEKARENPGEVKTYHYPENTMTDLIYQETDREQQEEESEVPEERGPKL